MSVQHWLDLLMNNVAGIVATVVGGVLLVYVRRALFSNRELHSLVTGAPKGGPIAGRLDVLSLQGWARGVDLTLADLRDDIGLLALHAGTTSLAAGPATEGRRMRAWIAARAKAVVAGIGLAMVGLTEFLVSSPDITGQVGRLLPAPWDQAIPLLVGALYTLLVHQIPNAPLPGAPGGLSTEQADAIRTIVEQHLADLNSGRRARPAAPIPVEVDTATGRIMVKQPGGN